MSFMKLLSVPALALAAAATLGVSSGALAHGRELFGVITGPGGVRFGAPNLVVDCPIVSRD